MVLFSDDDKIWIKLATSDASMLMYDVVNKMVILAAEKQRRCEKNGWKTVRFGGYEISPGDVASKTITWLNKLKRLETMLFNTILYMLTLF
jgi:hypothetical protein